MAADGPDGAIHLERLAVWCVIGVHDRERTGPQRVWLDVTLHADLEAASHSDQLDDTIDYANLERRIAECAEASAFQLLERLAGAVADLCLAEPRVRAVRVRVDKPQAARRAKNLGVELFRRGS